MNTMQLSEKAGFKITLSGMTGAVYRELSMCPLHACKLTYILLIDLFVYSYFFYLLKPATWPRVLYHTN